MTIVGYQAQQANAGGPGDLGDQRRPQRNILNGFGDRWLTAMDGINLGEMFERASANRRIAQPRQRHCNVNLRTDAPHFADQPLVRRRPSAKPISRSPAWRQRDSRSLVAFRRTGTALLDGGMDRGRAALKSDRLTSKTQTGKGARDA